MPSQKLGVAMPSTAIVPAARSRKLAAIERGNHAKRNADEHGQQHRPGNDRKRVRQARKEHIHRRLAHADRHAEIAVQRVADERDKLREERAIEAERLDQARPVLGRGILRQHQIDRIAGEPAEKEDDCRHEDRAAPGLATAGAR